MRTSVLQLRSAIVARILAMAAIASLLTVAELPSTLYGQNTVESTQQAEPRPGLSKTEPLALASGEPRPMEWFEREVRPLLAEHCYSCHSSSLAKPKGNLRLDSREGILAGGDSGPAAVPGQPTESLLVEAIRRESLEMPPNKPLPARDRETLARWIAMGLPWPATNRQAASGTGDWLAERAASHWAWQPVTSPRPPDVRHRSWPSQPIDNFICQGIEAAQLDPVASAAPHVLLRRLSFDLTGLPPDRMAVEEYAENPSREVYARHVDRLLSSPQFGVKWGRHWLDMMRYAETLGHEFDYPIRHAWRYRDSVIDSLNSDTPYSEFVVEHVAGDLVGAPRRHPVSGINQSLALTGWWWLGESVHAPVDVVMDEAGRLDHQIEVFSKTFLGMTVACARCHDHKFDAIGAADYYRLCGVIQSSRRTYFPTDPSGDLARHNQAIASEVNQAEEATRLERENALDSLTIPSIREWLAGYLVRLREKPDVAKEVSQVNSPMFALTALVNSDEATAFVAKIAQARKQLHAAQRQWNDWLAQSVLLAEFANGLPSGWSIEAADERVPGAATGESSVEWFAPSGPIVGRKGVFSSKRLGQKQCLTLRSPTFDLMQPALALRIRGAKAKSTVVVDNYFMIEFHKLLFKDVATEISQPNDTGWVTHVGDLNKYVGRKAYLETSDDGDGWFEIEQVRAAASSPPPQTSELADELLSLDLRSDTQLLDQFALQIERSAKRLARGDANADETALIRALMRADNQLGTPSLFQMPRIAERASQLALLDRECPAPTRILAMTEGTPRDARLSIRGNPRSLGEIVPRGDLAALAEKTPIDSLSTGRWEIAQSLVKPSHPLTSRVMVNRVWHHLMGRGLVDSPDNLGVLGGKPTHPELLDYLAAGFVQHDWSVKWLIREIVLSETYRLGGEPTADQRERDPDARLWSHRPIRRLQAEDLRDEMLAVAGSIDLENSGESVEVHLTAQMTGRGRPKESGPLDGFGRRSLFVETRRNFLQPLLVAFDFPAPSTAVGKRNVSNVPAQSLALLNDPLVIELASRWAQRAVAQNATPRERVENMYYDAFARPPTTEELRNCLAMVQSLGEGEVSQESWTELAHVLFNSKEFLFLR